MKALATASTAAATTTTRNEEPYPLPARFKVTTTANPNLQQHGQQQERRDSATLLLQKWWRGRRPSQEGKNDLVLYSPMTAAGATSEVQTIYNDSHYSIEQKHELVSAYRQARHKVEQQHHQQHQHQQPMTPQLSLSLSQCSSWSTVVSTLSEKTTTTLRDKWKAKQPMHQRHQAAKRIQRWYQRMVQPKHTFVKKIQNWYRRIVVAKLKQIRQREAAIAIQVRWKYHRKVSDKRLADRKAAEMLQLCWWRKLSPKETKRIEKDTTKHPYSHIPLQVQQFVRESRQDRAAEVETAKLLHLREEDRILADDDDNDEEDEEEEEELLGIDNVSAQEIKPKEQEKVEDLQRVKQLPLSSRHRNTRESLIVEPTMDVSTETLLTPGSPPMSPKAEPSLPTIEVVPPLKQALTPMWRITPLEEPEEEEEDLLSPILHRKLKKVPSEEAETPVRGSTTRQQSAARGAHVRKVMRMRQQAACVKLQGWSRMVSCRRAYDLQKRMEAKKQQQQQQQASVSMPISGKENQGGSETKSTKKTREKGKKNRVALETRMPAVVLGNEENRLTDDGAEKMSVKLQVRHIDLTVGEKKLALERQRWDEKISPMKSPLLATSENEEWEEEPTTTNTTAKKQLMIPKLEVRQIDLSVGDRKLAMEKQRWKEKISPTKSVRIAVEPQQGEGKAPAANTTAKTELTIPKLTKRINFSVGDKKLDVEKKPWEKHISAGKPAKRGINDKKQQWDEELSQTDISATTDMSHPKLQVRLIDGSTEEKKSTKKKGKKGKVTPADVVAKVGITNAEGVIPAKATARVAPAMNTKLQVRHIDLSVGDKKVAMEKQRWEEKISPRRVAGKPIQPKNASTKARVDEHVKRSPDTIDLKGLYRRAFALRSLELREMRFARIRAARLLQHWWTTSLLVWMHINQRRRACTHIQAVYRGYLYCTIYQRLLWAATVIQDWWRDPCLQQRLRRRLQASTTTTTPTSPASPQQQQQQQQQQSATTGAVVEEAGGGGGGGALVEKAKWFALWVLTVVVCVWAIFGFLLFLALIRVDGILTIKYEGQ